MNPDKKQKAGMVGALLLFLGAFAPVLKMPLGSLNYMGLHFFINFSPFGDGVIILILAVASFLLILYNKEQALFVTSLISLMVLITTYMEFQEDLVWKYRFVDGIAQLGWGVPILLIGITLIFYAALGKSSHKEEVN